MQQKGKQKEALKLPMAERKNHGTETWQKPPWQIRLVSNKVKNVSPAPGYIFLNLTPHFLVPHRKLCKRNSKQDMVHIATNKLDTTLSPISILSLHLFRSCCSTSLWAGGRGATYKAICHYALWRQLNPGGRSAELCIGKYGVPPCLSGNEFSIAKREMCRHL